ncbi:hypothetical protein CCO02nite_03160 [Cellulomonas composti]|uniref:AbiEi antitoxin C-terminal domain-containing protein n=1 Tax=Cellulomonas composti TaxID=266130 RepID=A0A511J6N9_9CELL|nr:hypothetical protein CCO02nite_03160 [Cellulomonas composti]
MAGPSVARSLLPAIPELERLVSRSGVGGPAWSGMVRDGALTPLWGGTAIRGDAEAGPTDRAHAIAHLLPRRGVVGRASAVWVHAGGPPPVRVDVLLPVGSRRPYEHPDRRCAETLLPAEDLDRVGDVAVTNLVRTAVDVARWLEPDVAHEHLRRLVVHGLDLAAARTLLETFSGRRRARLAREVLDTVA